MARRPPPLRCFSCRRTGFATCEIVGPGMGRIRCTACDWRGPSFDRHASSLEQLPSLPIWRPGL